MEALLWALFLFLLQVYLLVGDGNNNSSQRDGIVNENGDNNKNYCHGDMQAVTETSSPPL